MPANTIDHIVPQSSGWGKSNVQNLLPACKLCNTKKRDSDIFSYANSKKIHEINRIRANHNLSSLQKLKEQYLAWKGANMPERIFAIKLSQTGKISGSTDNSLYNRLKTLIGLYMVMVDNQQLDIAKEILDTLFTSNDYEDMYRQHAIGNLESINPFIRNKKLKDIVAMLRKIYQNYSNNKITPVAGAVEKATKDNVLELIIAKYTDPQEQIADVTEEPSISYLSSTIAEINQITNKIKSLRSLEKERVAVEQQIAHYQKIKTKIDVEYQQVIHSLDELSDNELISVIIHRLKSIQHQ